MGLSEGSVACFAEPTKTKRRIGLFRGINLFREINLAQYVLVNGPGGWCQRCNGENTLHR
jgi:hypothetical protein